MNPAISRSRGLASARSTPRRAALCAVPLLLLMVCSGWACRRSAEPYENGLASPVGSLTRLAQGRVKAVVVPADAVADAVNGLGPFSGNALAARTIAVFSTRVMHLVTVPRARIHQMSELRGHVVSTGPAGSSTEFTADRIVRAAGIDPDRDISRRRLDINPAMDALRRGSIDALFWLDDDPSAELKELAQNPGATPRLVATSSAIGPLVDQYGRAVYLRAEIPQGLYRNVIPIATVGVRTLAIARSDLPDDEAYELAQRFSALGGRAPSASGERGGPPDSPAALHPGAARFYDQRR